MIKKYTFSNYTYTTFCNKFKENLIEEKDFDNGFYAYSVFNINNTTIILTRAGASSAKKELTIGLDEKNIENTVELIKSKGFKLEEIVEGN